MSLSGIYGESSDDNGMAVIQHALDKGINFLDSADMYGWGHNETLVGKALKGRREGRGAGQQVWPDAPDRRWQWCGRQSGLCAKRLRGQPASGSGSM